MQELIENVQTIIQHQQALAFLAVFIAGLISAASPCVLAAIPLVVGYVGGYSEGSTKRAALYSLVFVLGLSITFTVLGASASVAGQFLSFAGRWLYIGFAVMAVLMGLHLMGIFAVPIPFQRSREVKTKGLPGALMLGLLTGTVSSPCATPVLAVILAYVTTEADILYGASLLFTYAVGHCALIFFCGLSIGLAESIINSRGLRNFSLYAKKASGFVLIIAGLYIGISSFVSLADAVGQADVCPSTSQRAEDCAVQPGDPLRDIINPGERQGSTQTFQGTREEEGRVQQGEPSREKAAAGEQLGVKKASRSDRRFVVYFFWGDGCPHCMEEKPFLKAMKAKYPQMELRDYEVWYNRENAKLLSDMAAAYGMRASGVPVTFIGHEAHVGFSAQIQEELERSIRRCAERGCVSPLAKMTDQLDGRGKRETRGLMPDDPVSTRDPVGDFSGLDPREENAGEDRRRTGESVTIPFIGTVDASEMSLPFMTLVIAGLDSFNPCAFFVLFALLGLLVHARSRSRMFFIGGIFVFFSGFIYFVFMAAWLNLFLVMGQVAFITTAAGIVALGMAAINIKDFFAFKAGVSLTIPDSAKPKLFDRMRRLMRSTSVVSMIIGTAVLAIAANSYELLCTAGFPMVFTRILTLNHLPLSTYYLYLAFYNVVYVIPLAVIVAIFTYTLGKRQLTERQGRLLKLFSGTMMLGLGAVLLLKPALLNNVLASVALLAGALALSGVLILIERRFSASRK